MVDELVIFGPNDTRVFARRFVQTSNNTFQLEREM